MPPNKATAPNAAMTLRFPIEQDWRGIDESRRSAKLRRMTIHARLSVVAVCALAVTVCGCVHSPPSGARLRSAEAIRIAKAAAKQDGRPLRHYRSPEARYYREDATWFVAFQGRGWLIFSKAGDHFAVFINDVTGETRISPGM
jgi:hypothetical protein